MHPPTRFLTTPDGTRIGYCTIGSGPPLVFVRGWMSNCDLVWDSPKFCNYFEPFAEHFQFVVYDMRGNGVSQRDIERVDLETALCDLGAVVDALGLGDLALYGQCFGGPTAIAYAALHPERVSRLILDGTYARGAEIASDEQRQKLMTMFRELPDAAMLALGYYTDPEPDATITLREHYQGQRRRQSYVTPDAASKLYTFGFEVDVQAMLPDIRMPTLVMHRRQNLAVPFDCGQDLAARIDGARFVALHGSAANPWDGDLREPQAALADFLGVHIAPARAPADRRAEEGSRTILFTDIESSTAKTVRLGDATAQTLIRAHNTIVRDALATHGGTEIKHTGDGIMASFASAVRAVECAVYVQRALASRDPDAETVVVRIGLNAGEPVAEEDDLFGTSVQLAKRVCDAGAGGDIMVSNVVRELCAGKGLAFRDRGAHALKGFDEPVQLFEVMWRP